MACLFRIAFDKTFIFKKDGKTFSLDIRNIKLQFSVSFHRFRFPLCTKKNYKILKGKIIFKVNFAHFHFNVLGGV